jgi:hypothetical protein
MGKKQSQTVLNDQHKFIRQDKVRKYTRKKKKKTRRRGGKTKKEN